MADALFGGRNRPMNPNRRITWAQVVVIVGSFVFALLVGWTHLGMYVSQPCPMPPWFFEETCPRLWQERTMACRNEKVISSPATRLQEAFAPPALPDFTGLPVSIVGVPGLFPKARQPFLVLGYTLVAFAVGYLSSSAAFGSRLVPRGLGWKPRLGLAAIALAAAGCYAIFAGPVVVVDWWCFYPTPTAPAP